TWLRARERWDALRAVFGESDTVAHHFWRFHDPRSPRHAPGPFAGAIARVYEALDRAVGVLLAAAPPDTAVAVVSDHGSGGASDRVVHLNRGLAACGLLALRPAARGRVCPLARGGGAPGGRRRMAARGALRGALRRARARSRARARAGGWLQPVVPAERGAGAGAPSSGTGRARRRQGTRDERRPSPGRPLRPGGCGRAPRRCARARGHRGRAADA